MIYKVLCGIIAATLFLLYEAPVVLKLKDVAMSVVVALGIGMMLVDLWQSMQSKDD